MDSKEEELSFISSEYADDESMDTNNAVQQSTDYSIGGSCFKQSKHPSVAFFHLAFKIAAMVLYVFGSWFSSSFIFQFVMCILLLACDFWMVKNVSGRLLVGLRWWSYVKEDGSNEWVFESLEDMTEIAPLDSRIFWGAMYLTPLLWGLLLFVGILRLSFQYMPVVMAAIFMTSANTVGFMKCSAQQQAKANSRNSTQDNADYGLGSILAPSEGSSDYTSGIRNWLLSSVLAVAAPPPVPPSNV